MKLYKEDRNKWRDRKRRAKVEKDKKERVKVRGRERNPAVGRISTRNN